MNDPSPVRRHIPAIDPNTCPVCEGNLAMMEGGECRNCHSTGRIWIYQGTTQIARDKLGYCLCMFTGRVNPKLGTVSGCPLCHEGGGVLKDMNWHLYQFIVNHLSDIAAFRPNVPDDRTTVRRGADLIEALATSSQHRVVNESVAGVRYYVAPARTRTGDLTKLPDRYDVFLQDALHPLGTAGQNLIMKHGKLEDCQHYLAQHPRIPPRPDGWHGW